MKRIAIFWLLLVLSGWAAVLPDGSQLPPSDPDAPAAIVPAAAPGGTPMRVQAVGPAGFVSGSPASGSTLTPHGPGTGSKGKPGPGGNPGVGNQSAAARPSPGGDAQRPWLPSGQPVPWSLIALAGLLFLFAIAGGVYFYQSRDD